jgi:putative membrane protein
MIGLLAAAVAAANIDQPYPELAPLQHVPTVLLILAAPWALRRWPLSTTSVAALWLFLLAHTLGGRYIYSYVPYDLWAQRMTGETVSGPFGWTRNHYDRLIHFLFGALCTVPIREVLVRWNGLRPRVALFTAFAFVGLVSAFYEIFEWLLTVMAAGDTADYYNGQQGDTWDPQKDMALAQLGSLTVIGWASLAAGVRRRA